MGQIWHRFWPGLPMVAMAQETGIEAKPVLPALTLCSSGLPDRDIPHLFSATVERDETYSGRQWKNKRHRLKTGVTKPSGGTSYRLVCGILCPGGEVWAQVVPDVAAKTLLPRICRRLEVGSSVCSNSGTSDTGIAAKD
ncbi:hypothetical protein CMK12_15295 [Candidatus Poribacteria bacterium]|jgi:hypothetical protein|nr:hypothetical protein [Candidatus Poribacteria bacterium]MDP6599169.1 hypothetical protein [Candidatus Poribacteria bacterium]